MSAPAVPRADAFAGIRRATATMREAREEHPELSAELDAARLRLGLLEKFGLADARPLERLQLERIAAEGVPQIAYLREAWLAENDVALLATAPGVGKSTFALALAYSIASGTPFLDAPGSDPRPVVYVDGEAGAVELARHALRTGPPVPNLHLFSAPGITLTKAEDAASVEREIVSRGAALLVLDTASSTFGLRDENDAAQVARVFATLNAWRDRHSCAVLVLHHLNKGGGDNAGRSPMDRVRGSSVFAALASVLFYGERAPGGRYVDITCPGKARGRSANFSARVELVEDGDRIALRSLGAPERAEGVLEAAARDVRAVLAESPDKSAKRGAVVEALAVQWEADTVDRALKHLKALGVVSNPVKGYWQLAADGSGE
jgi:hypothetical protein